MSSAILSSLIISLRILSMPFKLLFVAVVFFICSSLSLPALLRYGRKLFVSFKRFCVICSSTNLLFSFNVFNTSSRNWA